MKGVEQDGDGWWWGICGEKLLHWAFSFLKLFCFVLSFCLHWTYATHLFHLHCCGCKHLIICTLIQKCYSVVLDFEVFEHKQLPCLCKRSHVKIQSCFSVRSPNLTIQTCWNPPDLLAKTERLFGIATLNQRYLLVGWPMPGMHWRSRLWRFKRLAGAIIFLGKTDGEDVLNFWLIPF